MMSNTSLVDGGKVTDGKTRPLPLFSTMIFRKPFVKGGFYYAMGW